MTVTSSGLPVKKIVFTKTQVSKLYIFTEHFFGNQIRLCDTVQNARRLKPQYTHVISGND